jgi:hypothetical protein
MEWTLQPCRIISSTFADDRTRGPETFDFKRLKECLGGQQDPGFQTKVLAARDGSYVGQIQTPRGVLVFVMINPDLTGSFGWLEKKDPTFRDRVVSVYRVERFKRNGAIQEFGAVRP